ncbi:hypothetical protein SAMN05216431_103107 [Ligilactobacillus sp. WC1T17]|uniref:Pore-forming protein n=1 Tax=Ligilactobacillus ruminis TaxID=1623 RepID=A0ABY1AA99_9LACO|nr:hypothetical protein SAMN05216431_103107 [Ligilactobacillus ruminis]
MKKVFYCQPDVATSVTCWSYTGMLFLLSLLLWLELTVFQIWTAISFLLFVLVAGIQLYKRRLVLTDDSVEFQTVLSFNNKKIRYQDIKDVELLKNGINITGKNAIITVVLKRKNAKKIYEVLSSQQ